MPSSRFTSQRLVAAFLLGCALFNYPLLSLFNRDSSIAGLPLLFVFLMGSWLGLIALMAWIAEQRQDE